MTTPHRTHVHVTADLNLLQDSAWAGVQKPDRVLVDLNHLADVSARRARMHADIKWTDEEWLQLVRAAVEAGQSVGQIAEAAGISRPRVYQIRDGK
jgi:hypothetical protein